MEQKVMLIDEVAAATRWSVSTVRRKSSERRKGRGDFPLPISPPGCMCKWLASDIEAYLASKTTVLPANVSTPRQTRQDKKAFEVRQRLAEQALEKHKKTRKEKI